MAHRFLRQPAARLRRRAVPTVGCVCLVSALACAAAPGANDGAAQTQPEERAPRLLNDIHSDHARLTAIDDTRVHWPPPATSRSLEMPVGRRALSFRYVTQRGLDSTLRVQLDARPGQQYRVRGMRRGFVSARKTSGQHWYVVVADGLGNLAAFADSAPPLERPMTLEAKRKVLVLEPRLEFVSLATLQRVAEPPWPRPILEARVARELQARGYSAQRARDLESVDRATLQKLQDAIDTLVHEGARGPELSIAMGRLAAQTGDEFVLVQRMRARVGFATRTTGASGTLQTGESNTRYIAHLLRLTDGHGVWRATLDVDKRPDDEAFWDDLDAALADAR